MKAIHLIIFSLFSYLSTFGQPSIGFSVQPKIGLILGSKPDLSTGVDLNLLHANRIISIGVQEIEKLSLIHGPTTVKKHQEVNIMLGQFRDKGNFRFHYQVGISMLKGNKQSQNLKFNPSALQSSLSEPLFEVEEELASFNTIGLPIQLETQWLLSRYFSLGLELQANLNNQNSYFIPTFGMAIGHLFWD